MADRNPHLLLVSPSRLSENDICASLFPDARPHLQPDAKRSNKYPQQYQVSSPCMTVFDLSLLGHQAFNTALLSLRGDILVMVIDADFGLEQKDYWIKTLSCLAAIPHIIVAIDNMSHVDYSQERFRALQDKFNDHPVEFDCQSMHFIPVDLRSGDNLHSKSPHFDWHDGEALTPLLSSLASKPAPAARKASPDESLDQFAVYLSWISKSPMLPGRHYNFDNGSQTAQAHISTLKHCFNPETLEHQAAKRLLSGNLGYGNLSLDSSVPFEPFENHRETGSFLLRDTQSGELVAFGIIKHGLRRATNLHWQKLEIDKAARARNNRQNPCVLWFTGLSGSGKSAVASLVEKKLHAQGKHTYVLDGDNVRHGLCRDLGFTDADRVENLRRISETAKLFVEAGLIVLVSFISPFRSERQAARDMFDKDEFVEIFVDTPLEVCEARDPKGLYKKARAGLLKNFTGLDSPYEPPQTPEITLHASTTSSKDLADIVLAELAKNKII